MPVFAKINSFLSGDNIARAGYFPGLFFPGTRILIKIFKMECFKELSLEMQMQNEAKTNGHLR